MAKAVRKLRFAVMKFKRGTVSNEEMGIPCSEEVQSKWIWNFVDYCFNRGQIAVPFNRIGRDRRDTSSLKQSFSKWFFVVCSGKNLIHFIEHKCILKWVFELYLKVCETD